MWNLKEDLDIPSTRVQLKSRLEGLLGKVESLRSIEVGFNHNPADSARDVTLYSTFDDQAGLDAYQTHPAHIEVGAYIKTVTQDRVVSDYTL